MVDWLRARWERHDQLRFLVIGGWNTFFGYVTFLLLYALLRERLHYLVIAVLAHAIAVVNAFVAHRWLVFRSREPWLAEFLRFSAAQLAVLGGGLFGLWVAVSIAHLNPLVGQAIVTTGTVIVAYLAHRHFSFASR